jgi:hypothetical protein
MSAETEATTFFSPEDLFARYFGCGIKGATHSVSKSAMQKDIRRGKLVTAEYWASILLASHQVTNLMHRLLIIASEDVGPANNAAIKAILLLYRKYEKLRTAATAVNARGWRNLRNSEEMRQIVYRAVELLCCSPKTRIVDDACVGVISPIYDVKSFMVDPAAEAEYLSEFRAFLGQSDAMEAIKVMAKLAKLGKTDEVLSCLPSNAATDAAGIMWKEAKKSEDKRPPFVHLVHSILLGCNVGRSRPIVLCDARPAVLEPLYRELANPSIPKKTAPAYAYDFHVRGHRKPGETKKFVIDEAEALEPKVSDAELPDPFYELAITVGAEARDSCLEEPRKKKKTSRNKSAEESGTSAPTSRKRRPKSKLEQKLDSKRSRKY